MHIYCMYELRGPIASYSISIEYSHLTYSNAGKAYTPCRCVVMHNAFLKCYMDKS